MIEYYTLSLFRFRLHLVCVLFTLCLPMQAYSLLNAVDTDIWFSYTRKWALKLTSTERDGKMKHWRCRCVLFQIYFFGRRSFCWLFSWLLSTISVCALDNFIFVCCAFVIYDTVLCVLFACHAFVSHNIFLAKLTIGSVLFTLENTRQHWAKNSHSKELLRCEIINIFCCRALLSFSFFWFVHTSPSRWFIHFSCLFRFSFSGCFWQQRIFLSILFLLPFYLEFTVYAMRFFSFFVYRGKNDGQNKVRRDAMAQKKWQRNKGRKRNEKTNVVMKIK